MEAGLAQANKRFLDAYSLKMIAIAAMAIDHVGAVFFSEIIGFRMVGRIAAPIFAFFIAEGYAKTRNVKKYAWRLLLFAAISMLPYQLVFGRPFNILFDFAIALAVLLLTDKVDKEWMKWPIVLAGAALAYALQTDGMLGISILVYLFHRFRDEPKRMTAAMAVLYMSSMLLLVMDALLAGDYERLRSFAIWIRPLALVSLAFLFCYNGRRGRETKYMFYWFYPVHLMVLAMVYLLLSAG